MLHFHFVTLFPETILPWMQCGILGKAHEKGLSEFDVYQLRDFANDKHRTVDDSSYGGGGGMVLKIEPLVAAVEFINKKLAGHSSIVLCPSASGVKLNQPLLDQLTARPEQHWIIICGRYEGIDHRFIDEWVDVEFSFGDFVVTGGELAALALADATIRQQERALGAPTGAETESFRIHHPETGTELLEYPQYTRPASFRGLDVPPPLLSGDHGAVARWRMSQSVKKTVSNRPDLIVSG